MHSDLDLRPEDEQLVRAVLRTHVPEREVRAFGSRVRGTAKGTSDLDLCVMGETPLPAAVQQRLQAAFSGSPLPMKVDLVEWADVRTGFRSIIESTSVVVQAA